MSDTTPNDSRLDPGVIDALAERLEVASSAIGKRISGACGTGTSTLTPAQYHLLFALSQESAGGLRVTQLAEYGGVQPSAVTAIVDRMVERGLLSRESDPKDRRAVLIVPTAAGLAEVDRAHAAVRDYLRPLLGRLEPDELQMLVSVLEKLWRIASEDACEHSTDS